MKKLLLLSITLIALAANAQTSVYHPFPDSNAVWNVEHSIVNGNAGVLEIFHYSYIISGDTTIGLNMYHKLQVPVIVHTDGVYPPLGVWPGSGYYAGCIRQDIGQRKVFFIPHDSTDEQLLYDFSLQVGDTVKGLLVNACQTDTVTVIAVDSTLINGSYRKSWQFSPPTHQYSWIEGIGSTTGLIETNCGLFEEGYGLDCMQQNGIILYSDGSSASCDVITSVESMHRNELIQSIYPNPFYTTAVIELAKDFENGELIIYNVLGKQCKQQKITSQTTIINRDDLAEGIYFIQVIDGKGQASGQRIVAK